jgi:hypothetical protein
MVKKIRVIEEEPSIDALDEQAYRKQMLEYQQAIDWKLWEMLKIMQGMAVVDEGDEPVTGKSTASSLKGKAVIVADDKDE